MKILALNPFDGGSHKSFLEDWSRLTSHNWTILGLPPRKWKWRMRHASVTFADQVNELLAAGESWDLVFCSDMLNLAEFVGLAPPTIQKLPKIAYFHENQFSYPFRYEQERDLHFGFVNMTTALAADSVWFNSAFNRDSFLADMRRALRKMPDYRLPHVPDEIAEKSQVQPLGIRPITAQHDKSDGPLRILWAARWEHDKDPDTFFEAIRTLKQQNLSFRLSVIGEQYAESPEVFDIAQREFADEINRWGYQPSQADYEAALAESDVIVSTAQHEFFGISVLEAMAAGAFPLLPDRLAYPEILSKPAVADPETFFYAGDAKSLTNRLSQLIREHEADDIWHGDPTRTRRIAECYFWPKRAKELDAAIQQVADSH